MGDESEHLCVVAGDQRFGSDSTAGGDDAFDRQLRERIANALQQSSLILITTAEAGEYQRSPALLGSGGPGTFDHAQGTHVNSFRRLRLNRIEFSVAEHEL